MATAQVTLTQAQDNLERQQELWELRLISREVYEQAVTEVRLRETELQARGVELATAAQRIQQERAMLDSTRYDLDQVTIVAPMDGIVTRRNIEEGETVVVGTMNNAGTVLMTIADFSILEAEVEVDETDIPAVRFGQEAEITIDALPDRTYRGRVTEIGNSPIQAAGQASGNTTQATNFKVVVTLDENVPEVRPGFTCTADITTATRTATLAVPIQATTVRDVTLNAVGQVMRVPRRDDNLPSISSPLAAASEPWDDATQEREGVFIVRENQVQFTPIATGIAGEQGEFNWSSQHLDDEVLRCRDGNGDGQTGRVGLRCVRLVGRRQRGVRSSNGSGRRSRGGCRVRMPLCPVACRRPWVVVGSVRAVVCRRSAWRPDRLATCPLRSGKRSRSCELRVPGCATLPVGSVEPRRLSHVSCVATRRLGAAVWRIGRRLRSGTATDVPSARR